MECFMYNWRILLGGAASAAVLAVGVAAPAFAQAASRADTPVSSLGGVSQNLGSSGASEALCNLASIPTVGAEATAAATALGAPCASTADSSSVATTNGPARGLSSANSAMPGLNSVSGDIPALGSATDVTPTVSSATAPVPQAGGVSGVSQGTTANNIGSSDGSATSSQSGQSGNGTSGLGSVTGSTGLGSVTGTLNNVTGNLPDNNSISNDLGQGNSSQGS
jgi:hypothetical protein